MARSTQIIVSVAAGAALLAGSQASAKGIHVTREQAGGMIGGTALGAVGGPVGGFFGNFLGKKIGRAFEPKPPQLGPVETPASPPVHWMSPERPLQIRSVNTATDDLPVTQPAVAEAAAPATAVDARTTPVSAPADAAMPPPGTLNFQLAALREGRSPKD